jgi:hypothetical protein
MFCTIFAATMTYFGRFMGEHDTAVILSIVALVLFFQIVIFGITWHHLSSSNDNNNTLTIIHILVLSSVTSNIEVSLVSYIAAIITFILCCITLVWFVIVNSQEIPGEMKGFIALSWMTLLIVIVVFTAISMSKI